ncbi:MAG TPA: hypothetical protein VFA56_07700 [Gaiellaceae bacterium]|nr:hypothetical protein [Gaiellaceae bacterium]
MNLRVIPTSVHGAVDHVVGPALIAAPELLRLSKTSPEGVVPRVNGIAAALCSNLTDYELSLKNVIPMRLHLALDAVAGATLAAVPLVTGARKRGTRHWLPHTLVGAFEIAMALTTEKEAPRSRSQRLGRVLRLAS